MNDDMVKSPAERRRARLRFRAARRGFKEVDLIFGAFAAMNLDALDDSELDDFEALLTAPDQEVYAWLQDHVPVPAAFDTEVFAELKAVCRRTSPTWNV
jgi:antitoxin CptB